MTEKILCIKKKDFLDLKLPLDGSYVKFLPTSMSINREALINLYGLIHQDQFIERTNELENDLSMLQIIPYPIIITKSNHIFVYKRAGETQESRLTGKYSFGVGGHVNEEDLTLSGTVSRELKEEIGLVVNQTGEQQIFGLIYDSSNKVGSVHLGIAIKIVVDKLFSPTMESEFTKNGTIYNWLQLDDMIHTRESHRLETWSEILYNNYLIGTTEEFKVV
jgi:predicted NUDIX family phosphoesterase